MKPTPKRRSSARTAPTALLAPVPPLAPLALVTLLALLAATAAPLAAAQPVTDALRVQLRIEERLLEGARGEYRAARSLEQIALRDLREQSARQDGALERALAELLEGGVSTNPDDGAEGNRTGEESITLRRLQSDEREWAATRELALAQARENQDRRRGLVARAERIRALRSEIARYEESALVDETGLDGLWEIELAGAGITGVIDFDSRGTLVTGSYRLSDGAQGSIRGTLANNRLDLDRIDWSRGFDTTLRGELNAAAGVLEGTWIALDVSGGAPGSGTWTARRISRDRNR